MNIFQAPKKLVQEKLVVLRRKIIICLNDLMKVRLHQLKHNIDIPELSSRRRKHYMLNFYYIRMSEQPKEFNFSQDPCGIRYMLKNIINFFNCNLFPSMSVNRRTYNTITSFSNDFLDLVLTCFSILGKKLCLWCTLFENQKPLCGNRQIICRDDLNAIT